MPQILSTELGGAGRYIDLGAPAQQNNIGARTVIAYTQFSAAQSVSGYLLSKCSASAVDGFRFMVTSSMQLVFGSYSSTGGTLPDGLTNANAVLSNNTWQHLQVDWDGGVLTAGIRLYIDASADLRTSGNNGNGTSTSDAANSLFALNRVGLGRQVEGQVAYIAQWAGILTPSQRANVRANGPLSEPVGLTLLWANQADLGPQALAPVSRSIFAGGALPPNLALGGVEPFACAMTCRSTATATLPPAFLSFACAMTCRSTATATLPLGGVEPFACAMTCRSTATATLPPAFLFSGAYERSSVDLVGTFALGDGDAAVLTVNPKLQNSSTNGIAWMNVSVDVTGVNGLRPTFRFLKYNQHNFGGLWHTTRRPMYSYDDGLTWLYFDTNVTLDVGNNWIEFRNSTTFTQNKIRLGETRQRSVHQLGTWLQNLASTYSFVTPTTTAVVWTPTGSVSGYDAQNFIGNEFTAELDSLGVNVGVTPFYCAEINDTSLMPIGGAVKKVAVIHGGRHAGEDMGDVSMQHTVEWICGSSFEARELRRNFRILLYPMCTAQGRATGGYRGITNGQDPNRLFNTSGSMEAVDKPKAAEVTDRAGGVTSWYISYHGSYQTMREVFTGGSALDLVYINKLTAIGGFAINNGGIGGTNTDVGWYNSVGYKVSVVVEHGDPIPMTDADLLSQGQALGKSFSAMSMEGQFDGFAANMSCASTASATIIAAPAPFACSMACASTAAAAVITKITMQAAMACSSTASATATTTSTPFACNMACASASAASVITQIRIQAAMTCRSMASASISSPSLTYYRASRAYAVPAVSRRYAVTAPDAA